MYAILIVIHVIISLFLIAVILLQAGKGGGLADTFGGSQMQNLFGTKSTTVLTKLTAVCAIGFIVTCISLAIISSKKGKSIIDNAQIPKAATAAPNAQLPVTPEAQVPVPASTESAAPQGGTNEVK
jgi:preprotein translocase subunit SecG